MQRKTAQSQWLASDAAEKDNENNQVPGRLEIDDDSDADLVNSTPNNRLINETMMDEGVIRCTNNLEVSYPSQSEAANANMPAIISQDDDAPACNTRASRRQKLLTAIDVSGRSKILRNVLIEGSPWEEPNGA